MLVTVVGLSKGHERISCYFGHSKDFLPARCPPPNSAVFLSVLAAQALASAVENTMAFGYCAFAALEGCGYAAKLGMNGVDRIA